MADVASCDESADEETAEQAARTTGPIMIGGDLAYDEGSYQEFEDCWNPVWGRLDYRVRPVPGNHEYRTPEATGYFDYWGSKAGKRFRGYYTFDYGGWRILALNSERWRVAQQDFITEALAGWEGCSLAFWHTPFVSSGKHGVDPEDRGQAKPLWEAFSRAGGDLVLAGHDHHYERFDRLGIDGRPDPDGMREIVVGTGGADLRPLEEIQPGSAVRYVEHNGILELRLRQNDYSWRFRAEDGLMLDESRDSCR